MDRTLELAPRDRVELRHALGTTLSITRGRVWLTQEDDPRDLVLAAGSSWTIENGGLALAEAQDRATLVVSGAALLAAEPAPSWLSTWGAALRRAVLGWLVPPRRHSSLPYV